jgi:Protein of unknown function (DUF2812)
MMFYGSAAKKIKKLFFSFTEEEQWLQRMLNDGWVLKGYDATKLGLCIYYFDSIQYEEQKNRTYKIDYRIFGKTNDFHEYIDIFEDTGWVILSTDETQAKHIFYTNRPDADCAIFSDVESYKEREKRKMTSARNFMISSIISFIISILFNIIFDVNLVIGPLLLLLATLSSSIVYYKQRKVYKSLVKQHVANQ